jgi:hypothetical protein
MHRRGIEPLPLLEEAYDLTIRRVFQTPPMLPASVLETAICVGIWTFHLREKVAEANSCRLLQGIEPYSMGDILCKNYPF